MKHLILILMVLGVSLANAQTLSEKRDFFSNWFMSLASIDSHSSYPEDLSTFSINQGQRDAADFVVQRLNTLYPEQIRSGILKIAVSDSAYVYILLPKTSAKTSNDSKNRGDRPNYNSNNRKRKNNQVKGKGIRIDNSPIDNDVKDASADTPSIMFMAHLDVTPEAPGGKITPIRYDNYDGSNLFLPSGITLSPSSAYGRHLNDCIGKTIITSDGSTLLGADDKAGCTILLGMIDCLLTSDIEHGDVYVVLTQNEDIGMAADGFDLSYIGGKSPDLIIDVDGDEPGVFSIGNFTAVGRRYVFHGNNIHPGDGKKDGYADALTAAAMFIGLMPPEMHPSSSEGEQGYIHCYSLRHPVDFQGNENSADYVADIRMRYFDQEEGDFMRTVMDKAAEEVTVSYPNIVVEVLPEVLQYENIAYSMHPKMPTVISNAAEKIGMSISPSKIRGGTTSSMMVAKGLKGGPCIYSGQNAPHSCYEWTCIEDLIDASDLCLSIIKEVNALETNK